MTLFRKQGVISGFCHDCYKVQILPEDLTGLIRTYFVLRALDLPRDNARKCMVELREPVPYPYKGYIFCESEDEAQRCRALFEDALAAHGVTNIHCGISHGCSEYGLAHPDFKYSKDGAHNKFKRPRDWDRTENAWFAANQLQPHFKSHHNKPGITIYDVLGFRAWIRYAEIIGDEACAPFVGGPDFAMPENFVKQAQKQAPDRRAQMEELRQRSK